MIISLNRVMLNCLYAACMLPIFCLYAVLVLPKFVIFISVICSMKLFTENILIIDKWAFRVFTIMGSSELYWVHKRVGVINDHKDNQE